MKRIESLLTRAALKRILSKLENEQRRTPSPNSPRTLLNVLNSGVVVDLNAAKRMVLAELAAMLRRQVR
jgi:hypothetical protein